jgi:hypothetical protein
VKGSFFVEIFLWLCFLLPGSPIGKKLLAEMASRP